MFLSLAGSSRFFLKNFLHPYSNGVSRKYLIASPKTVTTIEMKRHSKKITKNAPAANFESSSMDVFESYDKVKLKFYLGKTTNTAAGCIDSEIEEMELSRVDTPTLDIDGNDLLI